MRSVATERLTSGSIIDEEIKLEEMARKHGVNGYWQKVERALKREEGASLKPAERYIRHWLEPTTEAVKEEVRGMKRRGGNAPLYAMTFLALPPRSIALIGLYEMMTHCLMNPGGIRVQSLTYEIGRAIVAEINHDMIRELDPKLLKELDKLVKKRTAKRINWWARKHLDDPVVSKKITWQTGLKIMWIIIGCCSARGYDEEFALAFRYRRNAHIAKGRVWVELDEEVLNNINAGHLARQYLRPRYLPMVVQPYPWTRDANGGYIKLKTHYVSKMTGDHRRVYESADLDRMNHARSCLDATAWQINPFVYDVMTRLWDEGGGVAGMPSADERPVPPKPHDIDTNAEARAKWRKEARTYHYERRVEKAQRTMFGRMLSVADMYRGYDAFWYPHILDFRGRAYPIPPDLNHQGDDRCRGLLQFARSCPPGQSSSWVKVHLANCCGVDKVSFDQRAGWVDDHMDEFRAWVNDPMDNMGWSEQDKPFQALAAALALFDDDAAARLPIQVDGTCNGLQHYAAMGRDAKGARAVNLTRLAEPEDVYTEVAQLVSRIVADRADKGDQYAKVILPAMGRSIVKRTVMTSVYGVTMMGARNQILEAFKDIGFQHEQLYAVARYLGQLVLKSIGSVCESACELMDWLKRIAKQICTTGKPIQWTTPLGFPVVQSYRNKGRIRVSTARCILEYVYDDDQLPIRPGRQTQGFAPNLIHSLDGTHMFMVAERCAAQGVTYAAVHDSYWTHAASIDKLADLTRSAFVELHERPYPQTLHSQLERSYGIPLAPPPDPGTFDIRETLNAPFFFS